MSELGISLFSSRKKKRKVHHLVPSGTAVTTASTAAAPSGVAPATARAIAAETAAIAADKVSEELRNVMKAAKLPPSGEGDDVKIP